MDVPKSQLFADWASGRVAAPDSKTIDRHVSSMVEVINRLIALLLFSIRNENKQYVLRHFLTLLHFLLTLGCFQVLRPR